MDEQTYVVQFRVIQTVKVDAIDSIQAEKIAWHALTTEQKENVSDCKMYRGDGSLEYDWQLFNDADRDRLEEE